MDPSLALRPPVAATLTDALADLVGQCLLHEYPGAPELTRSVSDRDLTAVLEAVREAAANPDQRWHVSDHPLRRLLREVANPLRVGTMHEAPFVLERYWVDLFDRRLTASPEPSVADMRSWIDDPQARGLPAKAANLIIAAFAVRTDRQALLRGAPVPISIDLHADAVLHVVELVDERTWVEATQRAGSVFGLSASPLRAAASVASLAAQVRAAAAALDTDARALCRALEDRWTSTGLPAPDRGPGPDRLGTARRALALLEAVRAARADNDVLTALADADVDPSPEAVARSLRTARTAAYAVATAQWSLLEMAMHLGGPDASEADGIAAGLRQAFAADQFSVDLEARLAELAVAATELLGRAAARGGVEPGPVPRPESTPLPGAPGGELPRSESHPGPTERPGGADVAPHRQRVASEADLDALVALLRAEVSFAVGERLEVAWRVERGSEVDGPA